jgi:hypothetical protein
MDLKQFSRNDVRGSATAEWKRYNDLCKTNGNPLYKDLKKLYWQLRNGKKVIDIHQVIAAGGVHAGTFHPKLAICQATKKEVTCYYRQNGEVIFSSIEQRNTFKDSYVSDVGAMLPEIPDAIIKAAFPKMQFLPNGFRLSAPVPLIPAQFLPDPLTDNHYILWEVDHWKKVAPVDPWLLYRITPTFFVVLSGWLLTELERAVMAGRLQKT